MKVRLTSFVSMFAVVLSTLVLGCASDAPEANVLDPGKKANSPSSGAAGVDGKSKEEGGKALTK